MREVIILLDNESVELRYCLCDLQAPLCVVNALLAVPRRFRDAAMVVVSHTPLDAVVEDAQVARAIYMQVWNARMHDACIRARAHAYASPRRSPRLTERRM